MTHQSHLNQIHELAMTLAKRAGDTAVKMRQQSLSTEYKRGSELVTNADLAVDKLLSSGIRADYPSHQILAEESNPDWSTIKHADSPFWVLDPIDGTVNYAHGFDQSAISIAYCEGSKPLVGVVHNPFNGETFHAIHGQGAFLNGEKIAPTRLDNLQRALVGTGFPYDRSARAALMPKVAMILEHCGDIRRMGAASLDICNVACGRLDAYWESLSLWDHAGAQVIAKEAGCMFGHLNEGDPSVPEAYWCDDIIVANTGLYSPFKALLLESELESELEDNELDSKER